MYNNKFNKNNSNVNKNNELKINRQIRAPEVRLIDQNDNMVGVVPIHTAIRMAEEAELDLVEISPNAKPAVCKICNYSKLKYKEQKKAAQNRKKQKTLDIKEIKISPNVGEGDFNTKLKQTIKFIENGNKVKFNFVFRGREIAHVENAQVLIDRILKTTESIAKVEEKQKLEGKRISFTIAPIGK